MAFVEKGSELSKTKQIRVAHQDLWLALRHSSLIADFTIPHYLFEDTWFDWRSEFDLRTAASISIDSCLDTFSGTSGTKVEQDGAKYMPTNGYRARMNQ